VRKNPTTAFIRPIKAQRLDRYQPGISAAWDHDVEKPAQLSRLKSEILERCFTRWCGMIDLSIEGPLAARVCGHPPENHQTVRVIAGTVSI
jgi:hypothetical protein